jgi:hypothetical protein
LRNNNEYRYNNYPNYIYTRDEKEQYEDLVQLTTQYENNSIQLQQQQQQESSIMNHSVVLLLPPPINRDTKIARFRMKQQLENERND